MDQFLTFKRAKLGPVFNFTAYMYIYIYIYVALTPLGGQILVKNLKKIPSLTVKNGHETPPPKRWGFFTFQCFFFFLIFAFFCHGFSSLPVLLDILRPKNGVRGYMALYVYRERERKKRE